MNIIKTLFSVKKINFLQSEAWDTLVTQKYLESEAYIEKEIFWESSQKN